MKIRQEHHTEYIFRHRYKEKYTASLGISVMLLSGTEVAATSAPDKSMTLNPKLGVHCLATFFKSDAS